MFAYIRPINPAGPITYAEIIAITPIEGVPPRPTPGPDPEPPLIIWGPGDPRPSNPIQLPPWVGKPQPTPPHPPTEGETVVAVVRNTPQAPGVPEPTPPSGVPAGSVLMDVWFGPGTRATQGWIFPYVSTGPVPTP